MDIVHEQPNGDNKTDVLASVSLQPSGAIFSDDRRYRYLLWRIWNANEPPLLAIGLNPSTADERLNDPTITRLIARAYRDGFGGLLMANLYAYVSTDPTELLERADAVGDHTDAYLKEAIALAERHLCGWGSFKPVTKRAPAVLAMIREPYCLGVNADGQPKHPLYVSYKTPMIRYQNCPSAVGPAGGTSDEAPAGPVCLPMTCAVPPKRERCHHEQSDGTCELDGGGCDGMAGCDLWHDLTPEEYEESLP